MRPGSFRRWLVIAALGLAVLAVAAGGAYYFLIGGPGADQGGMPFSAGPRSQTLTLYFFSPEDNAVASRSFKLPEHLAFFDQIRTIVERMVEKPQGAEPGLWPVPLRFRSAFLNKNGLLILDLDQGLAYNHATAAVEISVVRSLVRTLLANYPKIRRVHFLLNGSEAETLYGHVSLAGDLDEKSVEP